MGFGGRIFAIAVLLAASAASPAQGQDACRERRAILYLSNTVLTHRQSLGPEQADRLGADAAYLTLRYAPLEGQDGDDFVRSLLDEEGRGLRDLAFAWFVATDGMARAAQELGVEKFKEAILSSPTTIRPMVLANAEDAIVDAFRARPIHLRLGTEHWISLALLDLDDAIKARLADQAEEEGEVLLAAVILSTMIDQQSLRDLIARTSDVALLERIAAATMDGPILVGNLPLQGKQQPFSEAKKKSLEIAIAAAMQPEGDFLYTFLNVTGLVNETHYAATAVQRAIEDGTIRRNGLHDDAWLLAYRALIESAEDDERVDEALRGFTGAAVRAGRSKIAGEIDRIIAIKALRPYLLGETDVPPRMPAGPGGLLASEWPKWLALAELVRDSSLIAEPATDPNSLTMTAELLFAAGKADALSILLADSTPSPGTIALAADFAQRLDRGCASFLWHPGEPFLGTPIHKFDRAGAGLVPQ